MTRSIPLRRSLDAILLLAVAFATAPRGHAAEGDDGPVYLIVSLEDAFDLTSTQGSDVILVKIGALVGGGGLGDARFIADPPAAIPFPNNFTFADLHDNATTIVGAFRAGDGTEHLMTPVPDAIPSDVQTAFFDASTSGALDELAVAANGGPAFPSTRDLAEAIADHLPLGSPYDVDDVLAHVFATDATLHLQDGTTASVDAEGELFPHDPNPDEPLFHYAFSFDEEGTFSSDLCLLVSVDVAPGASTNTVNIGKKNGDLAIAILTTDAFDAADVDDATVEVGGVAAKRTSLEDVDRDGDDDLVCHFDVPDLADAGAITIDTTEIFVVAELKDGGCVRGGDAVNVID